MNLEQYQMVRSSKPFLRWWWFSGPLDVKEIDEQLDWVVEKGFGGVEIAWVYPLAHTPAEDGPHFLDEQWQFYTQYAVEKCKELHLGCDLTFGTLWPFGGSYIPLRYSSKVFNGYSTQRLNESWESRYCEKPGLILNHLDEQALSFYSEYLLDHGFKELSTKMQISFFCDSWEVETENLSYSELIKDFSEQFGYELDPFIARLDDNVDVRFDYRLCLSDRILSQFYKPYVKMCRASEVISRVQCHGAPTDILAAYALVDIPETETMLFEPDFALIAASAAAIWNKPVVSSESFTCIYGWISKPGVPPGIGEERIEDLLCVADAQFAWGVNRVVWHGKPYSTMLRPQRFYATVHLGPDGRLEKSLLPFNQYLSDTSQYLSRGETYSKMAVYFPIEDQWMRDELPQELVKPSSHYYWEFQETHIADDLLPWRPLWFSGQWLNDLQFDGNLLYCGNQVFEVFYCDAQWMTIGNLKILSELARQGAPIVFKQLPKECGFIKHAEYAVLLEEIKDCPRKNLDEFTPILTSEIPLDFWCRKDGDTYYLFISHPKLRKLSYPLPIDYHKQVKPMVVTAKFYSPVKTYHLKLAFPKTGSILCTIRDDKGMVEFIRSTVIAVQNKLIS